MAAKRTVRLYAPAVIWPKDMPSPWSAILEDGQGYTYVYRRSWGEDNNPLPQGGLASDLLNAIMRWPATS